MVPTPQSRMMGSARPRTMVRLLGFSRLMKSFLAGAAAGVSVPSSVSSGSASSTSSLAESRGSYSRASKGTASSADTQCSTLPLILRLAPSVPEAESMSTVQYTVVTLPFSSLSQPSQRTMYAPFSRTSKPGYMRWNFLAGTSMKSSCSMYASRPKVTVWVPISG